MDNLNLRGATINLSNAGLAAGTTNTTLTTATTAHVIAGNFGTTLAAQSNTSTTPTTDINTGATFIALAVSQACVFVWGVNAAGAMKVAQGSIKATQTGVTTTAGAFIETPDFPTLPSDFCPIGYSVHRTSPTGTAFAFGTTSWAASGITSTFKNVCTLPDRPQTT